MRKGLFPLALATALIISFPAFSITIDELLNQQYAEAGKNVTSGNGILVSPSNVDAGRPSAIGGARAISVHGVDGNFFGKTRLYVDLDTSSKPTMGHSQDVYTKGISTISWDGDTNQASLNGNGLGGVDFTQDGGDAVVVRVASFDSPAGAEATLIVRVHSGSAISQSSQILINQIDSPTDIEFPFSSFSTVQGGGVNWNTVGAVELIIDGSQHTALDLSVQSIGTNGKCALVPDSAKEVIDVCNVCDGDGKSCLDCKGVPFGDSKIDRCLVCGGDGTSCLGCQETEQSTILRRMDNGAKRQESLILAIARKIMRLDSSTTVSENLQRKLNRAHRLQLTNWKLSWELPKVSNICTNTQFCVQVSTLPILNEYRQNAEKLFVIANQLIRKLAKYPKTKSSVQMYDKRNAQIYKDNLDLAAQVPEYDSAC